MNEKMETIQAKVNPKLLSKASRLFTGAMDGRIIEVLQNTRRAGATEVEITNKDGFVTVQDNGGGIEDFSTLLEIATFSSIIGAFARRKELANGQTKGCHKANQKGYTSQVLCR